MAKFIVLVFVMAAVAVVPAAATAAIPGLQARRSRFLIANGAVYNPQQLPSYGCSKKSAAVCLAPGSPGPTCCDSRCVDTVASDDHCGGCNKVCKHGRVCCRWRCVDLLSDKDNCGKCFNQCDKKCSNGFCDYAQ